MVVWPCGRSNEKQLSDETVYKEVKVNEKLIKSLEKPLTRYLGALRTEVLKQIKNWNFLVLIIKEQCSQMFFLIRKRIFNVPDRPVHFNCGTPTEKGLEFFDTYLRTFMEESCSYKKNSGDILNKIDQIGKFPENDILLAPDVVGL